MSHPSAPGRRSRRWIGLAAGIAAALGAGALTLGAFNPATLAERIEAITTSEEAGQAFWGIYIEDVATGQPLYSQNATKTMLPASNEKILTSATALDALGSGFRYKTTLFFKGDVEGATMRGDLILDGSGDPTFGSPEAGLPDPLRQWARDLAAMGVRRVEGRLIGDDDTFDDVAYAEGWDIDYVTTQSSRALGVSVSGLAYHDNVVDVQIQSAASGETPTITMRPSAYLTVRNGLSTSGRRRGLSVRSGRALGSEVLDLKGSIPRSYAGTVVMPVTNPTLFTVHSLRQYLHEAGIAVDSLRPVDIDDLPEELKYEDAPPLFVHLSPPLSEILKVVNKESNNFYAEQVFRTFAWGGSAEGGERRVKELLAKAGARTEGLSIRDGSGLSRKDLVSPEAMARLLTYMNRHPERAAFLTSLARGGEAQSTLRYRLHGVPVQAKTGSLEYVRTLSGYATTLSGQTVSFAIFANNFTVSSYRIVQTIDRIILEMAGPPPPPPQPKAPARRSRRR